MESNKRLPSYYSILGICTDSSGEDIRRAYRKLAMQWHPDKWTRTPSLLGEAKLKFQQIQEAYSVLSDHKKRTMYDAGLNEPDEEEDEGFADLFPEMMSLIAEARREGFADLFPEMMSLIAEARREDKSYSMKELQTMFWEMAKGFEFPDWSNFHQQPVYDSPPWFCTSVRLDDSRTSKRARWDTHTVAERSSQFHMTGHERKKRVMPCWIVHASKALCRGCGLAKRTLLHTFSSVSLGNANLGDLDIKSFES
ncbi:unnamed protein product [Ilex paraguariensis]|uniref:J domain-containing protein n=1 Tax=Ilex paraguariensis TaxID=185542 RepID=A0ABC8SI78_9AQUA